MTTGRSSSTAAQPTTASRSGGVGSMSVTSTSTGANGNTIATQTPVSSAVSGFKGVWVGAVGVVSVAVWSLL